MCQCIFGGTPVIKSGDPLQRNLNDAAALQAKVAAKKAKEEEELARQQGTTTGGVAPVRKKVEKKDAALDDLLTAGLTKGKKK